MSDLEDTNSAMTTGARYPYRRRLTDAPLLAAATGGRPRHRPVWFMRQAGRSLPEYREIRAGIGMLESCFNPELVCEITMQPVRRHKVDAAILFSDIVVPLKAAGIDLDIVAGTGPVVANPVRTAADVKALPRLRAEEVGAVTEAIALLTTELGDTPLIGFAGAPFTLASYLVEGGPSRNHERTKALMHSDPATWHALLGALADTTIAFLKAQLHAGVDAIQLFDSWAGALSQADYRTYVLPHSERVFAEVAEAGVPRIHFGVGTGELLGVMGEAGADVVGVDWRIPLDDAARRVGPGKALQGNLDPAVLFAGWDAIEKEVRRITAEADRAVAAGAIGHIFNLGHGVLPDTDPAVLTDVVELVHSL
ncbi:MULTISPECIES: uroporphyrinogen decarboxylase [unclassified Rhodococcus (in: high G+C Gram-positive bacteria)]|jgi:uroporphyrinogen decarboxylase|uniref:uroporphyrinogen decarboxylase n=1 Tax=unclassified Rhodococcus (in: high G+C Gram-positive bacteria) TaxID=192944 RepID=UPI0006797CB6|nr:MULTISPECIES: uroporphyrinogen decarboxylase [unclassified Rhodococcus (in: high G+C Gram-positive bacteria)]